MHLDGRMDWISSDQWAALAGEDTDAHRLATERDGYLDRYGDWILWSGGRAPRAEVLRGELVDRFGFAPRQEVRKRAVLMRRNVCWGAGGGICN